LKTVSALVVVISKKANRRSLHEAIRNISYKVGQKVSVFTARQHSLLCRALY